MATLQQSSKEIIESLQEATEKKTSGYDTTAEVVRIEDGTAWVHIPGGVDETPVKLTINASVGDNVQVRVSGGRAWITGNASAPPTDDTTAVHARVIAQAAEVTAIGAEETAESVEGIALSAQSSANAASSAAASAVISAQNANNAATNAQNSANAANNILTDMQTAATAANTTIYGIYQDAEDAKSNAASALSSATAAQTAAANAGEYAARALGNLSTVQSVAETLTWITQHGTMTLTSDVALDPTHVYFVLDNPNGDYVVGANHYSVVIDPDPDDLSTYYELSIDESLNNYVGTHLALDSEGLWLLPAASGTNKVLIATGAGGTYTTAGTYIVDSAGNIAASFRADGATINGGSGTLLAHMGYGQTDSGSGTTHSPFYTFGTRKGTAGSFSFVEGYGEASKPEAHAEGYDTTASGLYAHAEGYKTTASGYYYPHAEGSSTIASGQGSHAEGYTTTASGHYSHSEGYETTASAQYGHAEGYKTTANGNYGSHAEGGNTTASGDWAHSEGQNTTASGSRSHAEGDETIASAVNTHAEGSHTEASAANAHAEGSYTEASAYRSHAQNNHTIAASADQTALGKYNVADNADTYAVIVGNGTADNARSNALTVAWTGNVVAAGDIEDGSGNTLSSKADSSAVPTATSDLNNDSGFLNATGILDLFYPVGSYYETSDTTFNPNNSWGGTWQLETEGQVHISGSTNGTYQVAGAPTDTNDGGSKDAIVVSHDHSVSITSGAGGQHRHSVSITSGAGTAHKHGTGNSTSTDFLRTESGATIGRRTIKRGTGESTENNLYSSEIVGHVTGTANESSHTHSVSGNTGYENVHTHSVSGNTGSSGASGTGANMQPYIIVNRWHRTA